MTAGQNWTLAEEVRDYWSGRAATFDNQHGHRITDGPEMAAWQSLVARAVGRKRLDGMQVLDLACGTGEISRLALSMGGAVTGVDFAEPMLERARAKHKGQDWRGVLADVQTLPGLPDNTFDLALARHLVWTLTTPEAAFASWARVLRPGGALVVIDGDWARESLRDRTMRALAERLAPKEVSRGEDLARHRRIMADLPYGGGLTYDRLSSDLRAAGFAQIKRLPLWQVYRLGMRGIPFSDWLRLNAANRFALVATT